MVGYSETGPKRRSGELGVIRCYPANLCPLGRYVVNEVRRLADDPLSHYERPNARRAPERRHCLLKHAVGTPGMTNVEQKKNDGISISSDVIVLQHWPVYFQHWPVYLLISEAIRVVPERCDHVRAARTPHPVVGVELLSDVSPVALQPECQRTRPQTQR